MQTELIETTQARDQFLSIVSHELKSPLTSILLSIQSQERILSAINSINLSSSEVLSSSKIISKEIRTFVSIIDSLLDLDSLLDVALISEGKLLLNRKRTNLSTLINNILLNEEEKLKSANIRFDKSIQKNVFVFIDKLRIEQVIKNLLSNAIKYAPGRPLNFIFSIEEDNATIVLSDKGPGIPTGYDTKIFDRFERAGVTSTVGLGLGLFISKEIILAHHGRIRVISEAGIGSRFIIDLPLTREKD